MARPNAPTIKAVSVQSKRVSQAVLSERFTPQGYSESVVPQKHSPVSRVVLAGPIGSGKSVVGTLLAARGAYVIEADRLGHAVLEPGGEAFSAVTARWPAVVRDGRIDRSLLAGVVFADPSELRRLEAMTHPHIARRIHAAAQEAGDRVVVVELPLVGDLLGAGWHRLVVLAPADVRLARAMGRGMDEEDVRRRMAAQPPHDVWEASADSVIVNDLDEDALAAAVAVWWERFVAAA